MSDVASRNSYNRPSSPSSSKMCRPSGGVKPAKKLGDDETSFMVASLHDGTVGNTILSTLGGFCSVPLAPRWLRVAEWGGYFFTLYTKPSSHGRLPQLENSITIQRLKRECPMSHHCKLDELLSSTDDTFVIIKTYYYSWFGDKAFSPFGKIEPSPI